MTRARIVSRAVAGLALAGALSGCIIVHDDDCWDDHCSSYDYYDDEYDDYPDGYPDDQLDAPATVDIDVGAQVGSVEPGAGAGLFMETDDAGHWRLYVACDTDVSGYECAYELYVQGEGISVDAVEGLEAGDDFNEYEGEVDLYLVTTTDFDGVTFNASPGAPLTLTMYLDGASQPELVYWVGGGLQNEGAPTNPITFQPRDPEGS